LACQSFHDARQTPQRNSPSMQLLGQSPLTATDFIRGSVKLGKVLSEEEWGRRY
jgi:hypothetical protein